MDEKHNPHELIHDELPKEHEDPLVRMLHVAIRSSVRVLAILMALVILWAVADVVLVMYQRLSTPPVFLLDHNDLFDVFGAFMLVLIAIEIFVNIRLYLGTNVIPVQLVLATALMAIARKVIVMDLDDIDVMYILGIGVVTLSLGVTYWLVAKKERREPAK
ncbi:phosphate-starvation-inducible PsiE family protein [Microbulbifer sp. ALW1]|uniref:phosphate-starvation-inducible PsiE family protein n=1 Tax=Microbulbifer sp. (strain ALW1) TaxID=1516059 RepID=UPI001F28F90E|nr:phosphate-starvation-inducible PsiE family protein [Microbulbifer sp. ALW1]